MASPVLCIVNSPTQYDPPLWAALKARGRLDPTVWYVAASDFVDPEVGHKVAWGNEGSNYKVERVPAKAFAERFMALPAVPVAVISEGWANAYTWQMAWLCLKCRVPMILPSDRVANPAEPAWRRLARRIVRRLTSPVFRGHITTGGRGLSALLADGVPPDRIEQALYPIDVALFQRRLGELRDLSRDIRARWPAESQVVVAVAKHVARESPLLIIDAFAALKRRNSLARLLFVGDGPMRGEVEAHVAALGLEGDVFLPGYVPYPKLPAYYGASDVFMHVAENEPWGISVSEAMACGLPVLATRVGGVPEMGMGYSSLASVIEARMSTHKYFSTDQSVFLWKLRVDGKPLWKKPMTIADGSQTCGPFCILSA